MEEAQGYSEPEGPPTTMAPPPLRRRRRLVRVRRGRRALRRPDAGGALGGSALGALAFDDDQGTLGNWSAKFSMTSSRRGARARALRAPAPRSAALLRASPPAAAAARAARAPLPSRAARRPRRGARASCTSAR